MISQTNNVNLSRLSISSDRRAHLWFSDGRLSQFKRTAGSVFASCNCLSILCSLLSAVVIISNKAVTRSIVNFLV